MFRTALALFFLALPIPAQTTWYVDSHGVAPGTGTSSDPYTSIQYAVTRPTTLNGHTLLVRPGTYPDNLNFQDRSILVRGTDGAQATIVTGTAYIGDGPIVEGLTFTQTYLVLGSATLRRCVLRNTVNPGQGSAIFYWSYAHVEQCVIAGYQSAFVMFLYDSGNDQAIVVQNTLFQDVYALSTSEMWGQLRNCSYDPQMLAHSSGVFATFENSIHGDAGCLDPANGEFHLRPDSHCIDAGWPGAPHDPDGSVADVGAYAFDPAYPAATTYCTSELNGEGCLGTASAGGWCSASGSWPYWVEAHGLPANKLGRLLYSFGQANVPFQGGTLCLAAQIHRTDPTYSVGDGSPCSGVLSFDFAARVQSGVDPELVPGRTVHAQFRYRDPLDPLGFGVGWTDAVSFVIHP